MKRRNLIITAGAVTAGACLINDIYKNLSITYPPERPDSDEGSDLIHRLLFYLDNPSYAKKEGIDIDDKYIIQAIIPAKRYIDNRYDCADFRMQTLMRILYLHGERIKSISPEGYSLIREAFLGEKYWMTEPGEDSACYWSENHQLLFAVSEYLAGQMWPHERFFNDNALGLEHMNRGKKRIGYWMEHVFRHGYTELNSSNYYLFDLGPASNFIQFASDDDAIMKKRMTMCMDLLLYDIVSNMYDYSFTAPTMRAYTDNVVGGKGDKVRQLTDYIFKLNDNHKTSTHHMLINFISMMNAKDSKAKPLRLYEIPKVIINIGKDRGTRIIKSSTGLDVSELPEKGLVGHNDNQIMVQLGMESFTNPEVIYNTVTYLQKNSMLANSFLNYFKVLNIKPLNQRAVLEFISKRFNPMTNGIAQQRANLYAYRTADYQLSCFQKYHPGSFGAQQMLSVLNFGNGCVIFTAHPARHEEEKTVNAVPGYWAGFGRAPHTAQMENVQLHIFKIPKISGFLELYKVPQFTHTYLPEAFLDEVRISGRYAFAKKGKAMLALAGKTALKYNDYNEISAKAFNNSLSDYPQKNFDLIQEGNNQFWIYELSNSDNESFEAFISRIKSNPIIFDGKTLLYKSLSRTYELTYNEHFKVDSVVMPTQYKRFDCDYIQAQREPDTMNFSLAGNSLFLDYENGIRELS